MRIRLLGTAAGGAFPQWNCNCANCAGFRSGQIKAQSRTQSSAAVSADGEHWFLLNASPDIGHQIASFAPLGPSTDSRRGSGIESVLITNADLDHTLGLYQLREGGRFVVYAGAGTRDALTAGLNLDAVLASYCGVDWRTPPSTLTPLPLVDGSPSGLSFCAFSLPGNPPKYRRGAASVDSLPEGEGWGGVDRDSSDSLGYRIVDDATGAAMVFVPDLAEWTDTVEAQMAGCRLLLIDGTFWSDDEMVKTGVGTARASSMGHLPISGPGGTLTRLAGVDINRKVYVHINNTNPILREDSAERAEAVAAGVVIGEDGMEFEV